MPLRIKDMPCPLCGSTMYCFHFDVHDKDYAKWMCEKCESILIQRDNWWMACIFEEVEKNDCK